MADNLDNRLLARNSEEEIKKAAKLNEEKFRAEQAQGQDARSFVKASSAVANTIFANEASADMALDEAKQAVTGAREAVRKMVFSTFFVMLILAIIKDLTDVPSCTIALCTLGTISNLVASAIFFILRLWTRIKIFATLGLLRRQSNKVMFNLIRMALRGFWITYITIALVEFTPIGFFPFWTIYVLALKINNMKLINKMKDELVKNEAYLRELSQALK